MDDEPVTYEQFQEARYRIVRVAALILAMRNILDDDTPTTNS